MELVIQRDYVRNQLGGIDGYGSRCSVRKTAKESIDPPRYLSSLSIEDLAQRWFLVFKPEESRDVNGTLCGDNDSFKHLTVGSFFNSGCYFSSEDATMQIAREERLRRACEMVVLARQHSSLFGHGSEDVTNVDDLVNCTSRAAVRIP